MAKFYADLTQPLQAFIQQQQIFLLRLHLVEVGLTSLQKECIPFGVLTPQRWRI